MNHFQRWIYKLPLRLRSLFRRRRVEQELDEEFQFHLDRQIEAFVAGGMDLREARFAALRAMGGVDQHKEAARDARRMGFVDTLAQDCRYAVRTLQRSTGFTAVAVLTLAIGIGGITTIFSVINGVILRPLPYEHPARLISIVETRNSMSPGKPFVAPPRGEDWKDRPEITAILEAHTWLETRQFEAPDRTESPIVTGAHVPPNYFSTIGAKPQLGRDFRAEDATPPQPAVAIISYPFWQRWLGADPDIVGKSVKFASGDLTVNGVMPPAFRSPFFNEAQLWAVMPQHAGPGSFTVGRMQPGITPEAAHAQLDDILKKVEQDYPSSAGRRTNVGRLVSAEAFQRNLLLLLFGSVVLILLMAVINVGNLVLSRSLTRSREVAIRSALGAGKRRLIRQLLTESVFLALPGGLLGLAIANAGVGILVSSLPQNFPRLHEIGIDTTVLAFALITTILTAIAFGIFPAFGFAGLDLQDSLKSGAASASQSRRSLALRRALVAGEVALTVILLSGASLTAKSFWNLLSEPLGIESDNVTAARFLLRPRPEPVRAAFYDEMVERLQRYGSVDSVAFSSHTPLTQSFFRPPFTIEGRTRSDNAGAVSIGVTPDYFRTLRIGFLEGRSLQSGEQAAVINETMAREFWRNSDAIGSRIQSASRSGVWLTIVGVVRDEKLAPGSNDLPVIYIPCGNCGALIVKALDSATDVATLIRREMAAVDPAALVTRVQSLDEIAAASEAVVGSRFRMGLFLAFAGAGLMLALAGVYGVTSYAAAQRTREMGIRLALGATRSKLLSMMMRQSMLPIAAGISVGVVAAAGLTRFLQSYLYEVVPLDPAVFVTVPCFVAVVAMIANFIPVRRGTGIDPTTALKYE